MHEYSIVQALLDRVEAEARAHGAVSVQRVQVRIGELAGVEPQLLATAFETFRERTICSEAKLDVLPVEAAWACPGCGARMRRGEPLQCAACGVPARLIEGDEIVLDRVEMEVT